MTEHKKNLLSALVFFVLGIVVIVITKLTIHNPRPNDIGPSGFPIFVGLCMMLLSLALAVQTFIAIKKDNNGNAETVKEDNIKKQIKDTLRTFIGALIMVLYIFAFDKVGYFISTFAMMTLLLILFKINNIKYYLITYLSGTVIWILFTYLFSVRLP